MTGTPTPHLPSQGAELGTAAPFHPQLGELAADSAKGGRVGVVVALPGEGVATFHLRPPGGGDEWTARADGATLTPVPAKPTYANLANRDGLYDNRVEQLAIPVTVHHDDGSTDEVPLILTPADMELIHARVGRLLETRERTLGGAP